MYRITNASERKTVRQWRGELSYREVFARVSAAALLASFAADDDWSWVDHHVLQLQRFHEVWVPDHATVSQLHTQTINGSWITCGCTNLRTANTHTGQLMDVDENKHSMTSIYYLVLIYILLRCLQAREVWRWWCFKHLIIAKLAITSARWLSTVNWLLAEMAMCKFTITTATTIITLWPPPRTHHPHNKCFPPVLLNLQSYGRIESRFTSQLI